ncbi:MAG: alpha/beta fold hydrolase [Janthinobacterium lividum]
MSDEPFPIQTMTVDGRAVGVHTLNAASSTTQAPLPVILLHGLGCSSDAWMPTLKILAQRRLSFPIYVPDMPGFGCSPGPKKAFSIPELADWLVRLMDTLKIPCANFAGNSLGGQVLLALARRHPERVGRVVLVGSTIGGTGISLARYAAGLVLDGIQEPLVYTVTLTRMYAQMGLLRYIATTKAMLEDEPLLHTEEIQVPCLVLRGARDGIIPDPIARRLAASLPNGQFRRLSGSAHAMQFTRPLEFAEIALSFWAGQPQEDGA